jgi:K+-transporting ATPase KdpF subunit
MYVFVIVCARGTSMNLESVVALLVSGGLMVYLLYALLRPEKF